MQAAAQVWLRQPGPPDAPPRSHLERCVRVKGTHVSNGIKHGPAGNGGGSDIRLGLIFPAFRSPLQAPPSGCQPGLVARRALKRRREGAARATETIKVKVPQDRPGSRLSARPGAAGRRFPARPAVPTGGERPADGGALPAGLAQAE